MAFVLDPRLAGSSVAVGRLPLCEVRLHNDARWPWLVLVPLRPGLVEVEDLNPAERHALMDEVVAAGEAVRAVSAAFGRPVEKLNVGALGNVVSQLHVHVVGRRSDDPAWPGPVWGVGLSEPYASERLDALKSVAAASLGL